MTKAIRNQRTTAGNPPAGTTKYACKGTTFYTWNEERRLITAEPPSTTVTFTYNADGRRVGKQLPGDVQKFIYDHNKLLQQTDASNQTDLLYTFTTEEYGDLLSEHDGADSSYYQFDALGSTDALLDDSGVPTDRYQYRAFGDIQAHTGSSPTPAVFVGQQSYRFDDEVDLYFAGVRYYDPLTGRWVSEDPIGFQAGDVNLYRYVGNNPVNEVDASGLVAVSELPKPLDQDPERRKLKEQIEELITHGPSKAALKEFLDGLEEGLVDGIKDLFGILSALRFATPSGVGKAGVELLFTRATGLPTESSRAMADARRKVEDLGATTAQIPKVIQSLPEILGVSDEILGILGRNLPIPVGRQILGTVELGPKPGDIVASADRIISHASPALIHLMTLLAEEGPHLIGYVTGMVLYEFIETFIITPITLGVGAVAKAALLPSKILAKASKVPHLTKFAKLIEEVGEFFEAGEQALKRLAKGGNGPGDSVLPDDVSPSTRVSGVPVAKESDLKGLPEPRR